MNCRECNQGKATNQSGLCHECQRFMGGMTNIEKRLQNTERALLALWVLIKDTMPPAYADAVQDMMSDYFDANTELGSDLDTVGFEKNDEKGDQDGQ